MLLGGLPLLHRFFFNKRIMKLINAPLNKGKYSMNYEYNNSDNG